MQVAAVMGLLKEELPRVYAAMIGERDAYMAARLLEAPGSRAVGVVGIAHLEGIERALADAGWQRVPCRPALRGVDPPAPREETRAAIPAAY